MASQLSRHFLTMTSERISAASQLAYCRKHFSSQGNSASSIVKRPTSATSSSSPSSSSSSFMTSKFIHRQCSSFYQTTSSANRGILLNAKSNNNRNILINNSIYNNNSILNNLGSSSASQQQSRHLVTSSRFPDLEIPADDFFTFIKKRYMEIPEDELFVDSVTKRSWKAKELIQVTEKTASALAKMGFRQGDVACLFSVNCPEFLIVCLAVCS